MGNKKVNERSSCKLAAKVQEQLLREVCPGKIIMRIFVGKYSVRDKKRACIYEQAG